MAIVAGNTYKALDALLSDGVFSEKVEYGDEDWETLRENMDLQTTNQKRKPAFYEFNWYAVIELDLQAWTDRCMDCMRSEANVRYNDPCLTMWSASTQFGMNC